MSTGELNARGKPAMGS